MTAIATRAAAARTTATTTIAIRLCLHAIRLKQYLSAAIVVVDAAVVVAFVAFVAVAGVVAVVVAVLTLLFV